MMLTDIWGKQRFSEKSEKTAAVSPPPAISTTFVFIFFDTPEDSW